MIGQNMVSQLYDCEVFDTRGEKIGSVKHVWVDDQTGAPMWASVHTGLFGMRESFVPLQSAELREHEVRVPVDKDRVKDSPRIDASHDRISDNDQAELLQYYGFGPQRTSPEGTGKQRAAGQDGQRTGRHAAEPDARQAGLGTQASGQATQETGQAGQETGQQAGQPSGLQAQAAGQRTGDQTGEQSGLRAQAAGARTGEQSGQDSGLQAPTAGRRTGDLAEGRSGQPTGKQATQRAGAGTAGDRAGREAMTRSEERLRVATERVEIGKVRLVKHVVTEEQHVKVPVSHEEVRVVREPITADNRDAALSGQEITEAEHEVTLHAEKPVVKKETVPVERVRLDMEEVADTETVTGQVRKEVIDVEDDRENRRDR